MKKECEMINDLLPLYIDGVCSEESKRLVEEHIKTCDACRKMAEQMKSDLVLPMKDSADVKGFRKFVNKKVWGRALIVIVIFAVLWIIGNWAVTSHWSEVWPEIGAEGIQENVEVVEMDGALYLHQSDLLGGGQIVTISTEEELENGIVRFYLGEQGLTSLDPTGQSRSWQLTESYHALGGHREGVAITSAFVSGNEEETESLPVIRKVIYCHKDGTEVAVLWEEGQEPKVLEAQK